VDPVLALRGFILGFTIAAAVGPISLLVIRRTLAEGQRYGLVSGLGVATADATYGAIAAFGLGAITDLLVNARQVLGLVGGIFLLWLAWRTIRAAPSEAATVSTGRRGYAGAYLSILGLTMANPMTILSFGALFAGLGVTSGVTTGAAVVVVGVLLGSATWWVVLTTVVGTMRTRITPTWIHRINLVSGTIVGAFALVAIASAVLLGAPRQERLLDYRPVLAGASENNVSWRPPGASSRAFSVCHGVRVGSARTRAPAAASAVVVARLSATSNATRMWPATRRPTSTRSMNSACAGSAISSVARPASRMTTRPSGETYEARSGRPSTSR
jgi:threonine/homoserine/homoserine lactone efflux protein